MSAARHLLALVAALAAAGCGSDEPLRAPLRPGAGWRELLDWDGLPAFAGGTYQLISSYDRDERSAYPFIPAGNKDFNNFLAVCGDRPTLIFQHVDGAAGCEPGPEGYLIAAADGPGFVSRILLTWVRIGGETLVEQPLTDERVRVYVDDLSAPLYDVSLAEWKRGSAFPFVKPLAGWTSGALVSYVPIAYAAKLRVYLDRLSARSGYYHQIETHSDTVPAAPGSLPATQEAAVELLRERAREPLDVEAWLEFEGELAPGETLPLLNRRQAGTLRVLKLRIPSSLDELWLEAHWDGAPDAAFALPLSWFFGVQAAGTRFDTLPMRVITDGASSELSFYLPMPFASSASVTLTNRAATSVQVEADLAGSSRAPDGEWGHLHVTTRDVREHLGAENFNVARARGRGKYVGTLLLLDGRSDPSWVFADPFNFLEGDPRFSVDGTFSQGTGTEELFDAGIYFRDGTFDSWFAAVPYVAQNTSEQSGVVTLLRWNVLGNAVSFANGFDLDLEYGLKNPSTAGRYRSVAFYYLERETAPALLTRE
ncbi:MAG TPA: DUF2961 domain-containing protein [Polyangiaceae bacterium]|nr:DUF2961 domain-containing protein [Polyangiaceae bacterium]